MPATTAASATATTATADKSTSTVPAPASAAASTSSNSKKKAGSIRGTRTIAALAKSKPKASSAGATVNTSANASKNTSTSTSTMTALSKVKPTKLKPRRFKSLPKTALTGMNTTNTQTTVNAAAATAATAAATTTINSIDETSVDPNRPKLKSILKRTSTTTNTNTSTATTTTTTTTGKKKCSHDKKIHFHNKKKTKRIPNLASYGKDILQQIWWNPNDYDEMMKSFEYVVFMMEAGEGSTVNDDKEHCTRGLELRTEAGKWSRFEHKRDCYNAVLDEQDRQWNEGMDNQDSIANCCRSVTAKTQRIACRKGMEDEKDIIDFVSDTRALIEKNNYDNPYAANGLKNWDKYTAAGRKSRAAGDNGAATAINSSGKLRQLPSRTKSSSTGQLRRMPAKDGIRGGRMPSSEQSPPRRPERALSSKSERSVTPTNSGSGKTLAAAAAAPAVASNVYSNSASNVTDKNGAPRAPKRTVSNNSSSDKSTKGGVTPTNSKTNVLRLPSRSTFTTTTTVSAAVTSADQTKRATTKDAITDTNNDNTKTTSLRTGSWRSKIGVPKMPKRNPSQSSSNDNSNSDIDNENNNDDDEEFTAIH